MTDKERIDRLEEEIEELKSILKDVISRLNHIAYNMKR